MLNNIVNTFLSSLKTIIYFAPILIVSITVHEFAHAYTAKKLGDNTAYLAGRVSLNPLRHIDPIGAVCMLIFGFGWGKAVPVSVLNFKNPQRDSALVALAGPVSNVIMACFWGFVFGICGMLLPTSGFYVYQLLYYAVYLNCMLCVFNLLPITPLDGSRILSLILPKKAYFKLIRYERVFFIILVVLMFLNVLDPVISFLANGLFIGIRYTFIELGIKLVSLFM